MSYQVNELEYNNVIKLGLEKRYDYFIKKCCDWEEVWSIKNQAGWCLFGDHSESECVPVWPAQKYAQAFCVDEWKDCFPELISLDKWLEKWIPGMERDKKSIAVFPIFSNNKINAVARKPGDLLRDIEEELKNY